jgi:hypothetical protein
MKKAALLLLFAAGLSASSCKKDSDPSHFNLFVDLQYRFDNDLVAVYIDGKELFNDTVTSHEVVGFALRVPSIQKRGQRELKIVVNNQETVTKTFSLFHDTWIGVGYDDQHKIRLTVFYRPLAYG